MKKLVVLAIAVFMITGCAKYLWVKPGGTVNEFNVDKYACMQETQQTVSSTFVYRGVGASSSNVVTNENLFSACMNARGWYLQAQSQGVVGSERQETSTGHEQIVGVVGRVTSVDNNKITIHGYTGVYTYNARDIDVSDIKVGDRVLVKFPSGNRRLKSIERF